MSGLVVRGKEESSQSFQLEQLLTKKNKNIKVEAVNQLRIKPVYDVSTYGEDVTLSLGIDDAALQTITPSTADFGQILENGNIPIDQIEKVMSDIDAIGILNEGDNVAFDQTYEWVPDMSAFIYKIGFSIAFGLNVSVFTSGSFDIDSIQIIITQDTVRSPKVLLDKTFEAEGLTALVAGGTQILLFNREIAISAAKITQGVPLTFQIIINETVGVGTRQVGIVPFFCFQSEAIAKIFSTSVLKFHVHPSLDHAFPVFRSENEQELLDFSGKGAGIG